MGGRLSHLAITVTGAAGAIGIAIAERLAEDGASLLITDVNGETLDAICADLEAKGATKAVSVAADLSKEAGANALRDAALAAFGRCDVLVNNAGGGIIRPFLEHTPETLQTTIDRNLWTVLWCCRAFLPPMVEAGQGRIINIGADSVRTGIYSHAAYNAAKGGVNGMTTGLAFEFGPKGIRINTVSPGGVLTPDLKKLLEGDAETESRITLRMNPRDTMVTIPNRRFAEMREVAALVAFLASDEAAAINGQVYSVNGGQWMMG